MSEQEEVKRATTVSIYVDKLAWVRFLLGSSISTLTVRERNRKTLLFTHHQRLNDEGRSRDFG